MSKTAIYGLLYLGLCMAALVSAPSPIEVKLYVSGQFKSAVCVSSDVLYWSVNDTPLTNTVINRHYGADVDIEPGREGHYLSTVTFSAVKQMLNNSMVSCSMNMTVLLRYHLTVVEADLVYLDTEKFSAICTNPSITSSRAPLFIYNGIRLVNVTINELYGANVTTLPSDEGHIQVLLEIIGQKNSMLNNSMVACLVDSAVIWKAHLIIKLNESEDVPHTTTVAVELSTITDDVNQTDAMPGLSESAALSEALISSTTSTIILVLVVITITVLAVVAYLRLYKRRNCVYQPQNNRPPDVANQVLPPDPDPLDASTVAVETEGPVVSTELAANIFMDGRTMRMLSLLRNPNENIGSSRMDPVNLPALDTSTSSFIQLMTHSYSDEGEPVQLSKEEESDGRSLALCVHRLDCKNMHQSYIKVGDDSSRQCYSVIDKTSDEHDSDKK